MTESLVVGAVLIVITVLIHFFGLAALIRFLDGRVNRRGAGLAAAPLQSLAMIVTVLGLIGLHIVEIWVYALFYLAVGAVPDAESALYFSTSTFTTVGFGDIVLDTDWRLLAAIESANGFILIGWSTAFLIDVTARLRGLERRREH